MYIYNFFESELQYFVLQQWFSHIFCWLHSILCCEQSPQNECLI